MDPYCYHDTYKYSFFKLLYSSTTPLNLLQYTTGVLVWRNLKKDYMAKKCDITGKKTQVGGKYSNRTRATQFNPSGKTKRAPNLQRKRIYVPELGKSVTLTVSTKALRTIVKNGAYKTLKEASLV